MATQDASKRAVKVRTPRLKETATVGKMASSIGYEFRDRALLEQALTHGSFFYEQNNVREPTASAARNDNERLEFLGDAVLGLVAAETLFAMFPDASEGLLTQMRSQLVSRKHLGDVAARLKVGAALRLGRGEERSGGRGKAVLGANALEAVAGAMFLDGGLEPVRKLFLGHIAAAELKTLAVAIEGGERLNDAKSALQEHLQANEGLRAEYALVKEAGPDHDKKFTMQVRVVNGDSVRMAKATRRTKKLAEQEAARKLLARLTGPAGKAASR